MPKDKNVILGLLSLYFICCYVSEVTCTSSLVRDLTLTQSQKMALDKFKQRVLQRGNLPHAYMKEEIYLVRWLRARNFNIDQADQMLKENLQWRKDNKIDGIMKENWSDYQERFPYFIDSYAKDGKPLTTGNFGEWDLRSIAVAGQMPKLLRYQVRLFEETMMKIRELQRQGQNVSQFDFLVNMDSYNLVQHGCIQCVAFYVGLINNYENHYPGFSDHMVLFNTPPVFETVLAVIRPIMSPITRKSLKVYGHDKSVWRKVLLEIADKEQLAPEYGGTLDRGI